MTSSSHISASVRIQNNFTSKVAVTLFQLTGIGLSRLEKFGPFLIPSGQASPYFQVRSIAGESDIWYVAILVSETGYQWASMGQKVDGQDQPGVLNDLTSNDNGGEFTFTISHVEFDVVLSTTVKAGVYRDGPPGPSGPSR
jgi:hypothetical protein